MKIRVVAAAVAMLCLLIDVRARAAADEAALLRVFLRDGTSLVSYGELARVADRVIFSLPTSTIVNPPLQLVNISADRVDWDRTNRYTEAARAARYAATQGEGDYVRLNNAVAQMLNDVARETETERRVRIVEVARKTLADWPASHYNFRLDDVRQMLSLLDEAIADLRASSAATRFDLSLVAVVEPPAPAEPLLPPPTATESIEQLLAAAQLTDSAIEQQSLLRVALVRLDREQASLPRDWVASTRAGARSALDSNLRVELSYQTMIRRVIAEADTRAHFADVRGIMRVIETLRRNDEVLGRRRPDAVSAALGAVEAKLDAARRLRLARDRWSLRAPLLQQYAAAVSLPVSILRRLQSPLDDIKELAGSAPSSSALVERQVARALKLMEKIVPPEECRAAHALLVSAAHLADRAARIRHDATEAGDITLAWDASSAAAGALMLSAKAATDLQSLTARPQLQ